MGKAKRNRQTRSQRRNASSLDDHQRRKKTLTPPMMTLDRVRPTRWQHERLPDFLWLQAIREETGDLSTANEALDILDPFVPDPPEDFVQPQAQLDGAGDGEPPPPRPMDYLDGRISGFSLVPEQERTRAREALNAGARWALPEELGHALALYPDCPAAWLYEDWAREHHADPEIGIAYIKRLVAAIFDPRGRPSSQVRLIPLARMIAHGKLHFREGMTIVDLLPRYPTGLSTEDQLHVEQWARASSLAYLAMEDTTIADEWVRYFWRHSYEVSPCEQPPPTAPAAEEQGQRDEEGLEEPPGEPKPSASLGDLRSAFLTAVDELGQGLRALQQRAPIDTHESTPDEVKLGLASRQFRLLRRLVADPSLWTNQMAPHLVRSMIDVRIVVAWLMKQETDDPFEHFKSYGQGKRKLFKLKLEDLMEREDISFDEHDRDFLDRLREQVNQDTMEEFQKVDLGGSFSGKNIREMATETELGDLYSLTYQPLSTEAHGEWGSLIDFDLAHCGNPLHKYHRLGRFDTSATHSIHVGWLRDALAIARDTIADVFNGYSLDSEQLFARCLEQMEQT
jgi:uncharacterized protein DUF5677